MINDENDLDLPFQFCVIGRFTQIVETNIVNMHKTSLHMHLLLITICSIGVGFEVSVERFSIPKSGHNLLSRQWR